MSDSDISVGELARQLRDAFGRLEGVTRRLEDGQFVRSDLFERVEDNFKLRIDTLDKEIKALDNEKADNSQVKALETRVTELEGDKTWLVRLVLGFIILGVLGAIYVAVGPGVT